VVCKQAKHLDMNSSQQICIEPIVTVGETWYEQYLFRGEPIFALLIMICVRNSEVEERHKRRHWFTAWNHKVLHGNNTPLKTVSPF
jgi:hypothetical protein